MIFLESEEGVKALIAQILSTERTDPIVCLTSRAGEREPALEFDDVEPMLDPEVPVYFLPTGPLTKLLEGGLPPKLHVFGRAA